MRAGSYAVWRGEVFKCRNHPTVSSIVMLVLPASEPQPEGFEKYSRGWRRGVDRWEVSRFFLVSTVAVWQGHRVTVESVWGDQATVSASSHPQDVPVHPAVRRDKGYGDWEATVPVWELTEVVQTTRDIQV